MRKLSVLAAALIAAAACDADTPASPSDITTTQALVQQLESRGATVALAETLPRESNPFFSVSARCLVVNGESMSVFEYLIPHLDADAGKVHPSGTPIGGTQITWIAPPRFYKSSRVIVIHADRA
jgi:hypothetical protein